MIALTFFVEVKYLFFLRITFIYNTGDIPLTTLIKMRDYLKVNFQLNISYKESQLKIWRLIYESKPKHSVETFRCPVVHLEMREQVGCNNHLLADIHPCIYNNSPEIWKPIVNLLCHNKLREEMHEGWNFQ